MRVTRLLSLAPLFAGLACGNGAAVTVQDGAATVSFAEARPGLAKRAVVGADSALAIARMHVPNGHIVEAEIDQERGMLVYEFEFAAAGENGRRGLVIDAATGAVLLGYHGTDDDGPDDGEPDDEDDDGRKGRAAEPSS